jgi:beta-lactamase superfamily II metal-dependent hydrolase
MVNRKWVIFLLVICMGAISSISVNASPTITTTLTVSYIDVGQGDSIWIHDSNGFDILIDGGKPSAGPTVLAYLRSHGIDDIEVMIASHPDSDHIGGLIDVLEATDIPVQQVLYSGYPGDTVIWDDFITAVANEGITLTVAQYPYEYTWGSTMAYILNPVSGLSNPATNDASVVTLLSHGNIRFLFPGDISSTVEAVVVAHGTSVATQILKVAHHGSAYSSSASFLSAVSPHEAIISVGDNSYGHPSDDTISRLQAAGARVWRTDQWGTIIVVSNGTTYTITSSTGYKVYLPLVMNSAPPPSTQTPTATTSMPTPTLQATPTLTATQTPAPTWTATSVPASSGNVVITTIFYDGAGSQEPDEYVEVRNDDTRAIQLQNWTLRDIANHVYTFPSFVMQPGQVCRVYTNQSHPESCSFNYGSGAAIWNNTGDCAYLRDSLSTLIDDYCY